MKTDDITKTERFIDSLEVVSHDAETIILRMPLHMWDDYMGTSSLKSYRVIVPYQEMIAGRMIYHVDAGNAQEAIELVDKNCEDVYDNIVDGSIGLYEEHWDQAEAEER